MILGAGITGLSAAISSGLPVYEAKNIPGGLCSTYYIKPGSKKRLHRPPEDGEAYRFEVGGGHWIFGVDGAISSLVNKFTHLKNYRRHSSVYLNKETPEIPFPLQNNLSFLNKKIANKITAEISEAGQDPCSTMKEWLKASFGETLCRLFFFPFNDAYTAGLYDRIAPQDLYKTPVNKGLISHSVSHNTPPAGYNTTFTYPGEGLNSLVDRMAKQCRIHYRKRAVSIDTVRKKVYFDDGTTAVYNKLFSTLPLDKMLTMTGLSVDEKPYPYTSALVLNLAATRGKELTDSHWTYIPRSESGFHRIGFYSNIDNSFLPVSLRKTGNHVSIYVERAYRGGLKPSVRQIRLYGDSAVKELKKWGLIRNVEVLDATWIDMAYTWAMPGSGWREKAVSLLEKNGIRQIGRYGRWKFCGIAKSMSDGFAVKRKA